MGYYEFKEKYHVMLNEQQEAAARQTDGAILLLAVPGSGKTTVLIYRLGYMIYECNIAPERILTVTYTVAAARDMKARFVQTFGDEFAERLVFRTINSLSQRILCYYGSVVGKVVYPVIGNKEKSGLLKSIFQDVNQKFATLNDVTQLEAAITYVKNMRLSENQIQTLETETKNFPKIYLAYQKELKKRRQIDFDDQMVYALALFEHVPQVLAHFQKHYPYLCVDEAQDTSKLQHDMLRLLASESGNFFMVGDEDQSIYGFRAAYPDALVSFDKTYPNAKVLLMETNYRSRPEIIAAADRVIQKNHNRHEKHMQPIRPAGGKVRRIELRSRREQSSCLRKVAMDCQEETAVLYRNHESALPLIDLLEREHIPYRMREREMAFFTHPIVTDLCNFIRLALNPQDAEAFLGIYYKMGAGISKEYANLVVSQKISGSSYLEAVAHCDGISGFTSAKCNVLANHFAAMRQESAGNAVRRILNDMGYRAYLKERKMDSEKANIFQMLADQEENLENFLPHLAFLQQCITKGKQNPEAKFILSTIHSSKGLEYDTVYLLDMLEGILPLARDAGEKSFEPVDEAFYEEERRLYYVGMTRAKNVLNIFTFRNLENSAFSREVFGMETEVSKSDLAYRTENSAKQRQQHENLRKPVYAQIAYQREKTPDKKDMGQLLDFEQGVGVVHKKFGEGAIVDRNGNTVEIYFFNLDVTKRLMLDYAVSSGILRLK